MTPRLVELADRSRKFLDQPHTLDIGDVMQLVADMRKALSRLMAEGGLVGAGASPLEVTDEMMKRARLAYDRAYGPGGKWRDGLRLAVEAALLVQANEVKRLSNPVDDGAVERALAAKDAAFYPEGLDRDTAPHTLEWYEMKAALEAAEPHKHDLDELIRGYRLTYPEAQGNKDLGEPAASGLEEEEAMEHLHGLYTAREISHTEAREIAYRLINSHFHKEPHARVSIPARPDYDDDLLIITYIKQQERKLLQGASAPAPTSPQPIKGESELESASNGMGLR